MGSEPTLAARYSLNGFTCLLGEGNTPQRQRVPVPCAAAPAGGRLACRSRPQSPAGTPGMAPAPGSAPQVREGRQGLMSAWCGREMREAGEEEDACAQHRGVWRGDTLTVQCHLLLRASPGGGRARMPCTAEAGTQSLPSPSTSGA